MRSDQTIDDIDSKNTKFSKNNLSEDKTLFARDENGKISFSVLDGKVYSEVEKFFYEKDINILDYKLVVTSITDESKITNIFESFGNRIYKFGDVIHLLNDNIDIFLSINIDIYKDRSIVSVEIFSNSNTSIFEVSKFIDDNFPKVDFTYIPINWFYVDNMGLQRKRIQEKLTDKIIQESYPFIPSESVEKYIDDFYDSDENVLILMGEAGTGKTRLIRYMLKYLKQNHFSLEDGFDVYYSTDYKILQSDEIFIDLITSQNSILVLEDIDVELRSREENNPVMYKLLASSDGLIRNNDNKIIISTNVSDKNKIDDALIRSGRCYDLIKSRLLTLDEANNVLEKLNSSYFLSEDHGNKFALSDIYKFYQTSELIKKEERNKKIKSSMGF